MTTVAQSAPTAAEPQPEPYDRRLVLLVAGAFFMELLDATIITTALPQMAESFAVHPVDLSTGVSAYMLAIAVFIPLSGWMADRFGPRQVFGGALLVFTLASLLCSFSTSLPAFTAARVLQGLGGAMMVPVGRLVVLRVTPKSQLVHAIALLTWPALGAPVLGPPLGGLITEHWGWQWIFLINVPLGLIGFLCTWRWVSGAAGGRRPFDIPGFVWSGLSCCTLMLACDLASATPFRALPVGGFLAAGLVTLGLAVRHLSRTPHPLLALDCLRVPTFVVAMRGGSIFRIAINSAPFLLPLMFQLCFGFDPTAAGLMLLALFAGNVCMKPATTWIMQRFGFRRVLLGNGVLLAAGFAGCALLTPQSPTLPTLILLFFCGLTRSMQFTALNTLSFCDVRSEQMNSASTLSSVLFQMNGGLGIALGAVALQVSAHWLSGSGEALALADFRFAYLAMAGLCLLALFDVMTLAKDAGDHVTRHRSG